MIYSHVLHLCCMNCSKKLFLFVYDATISLYNIIDCLGSYVVTRTHVQWNGINFILFKHLQLTSSCHLWFELFRVSNAILTGRIQCFSSQDRDHGHKRSCTHCRNHVVCVILFTASSTLLRSPVCRLGVGLIHQREKTPRTFSVSGVCVCVFLLSVDVQRGCAAYTNI